MNEYLYHGTIYSGLTELEARSKLHNTDQQVVYLTDNIPYALLYIWDENHNGCGEKHVTGWVRNGVAYYEEQFPDQLKTFYKGVSGYLYAIKKDAQFQMLENREGIHYSFQNAVIDKTEHIQDIYEELIQYEKLGKFKVLYYNEQTKQRQEELVHLISTYILENDFFKSDNTKATFMKKYFSKAWEQAADMSPKPGLPENNFPVSMIPWISFEGFNLNIQTGYDYLLPIFTMGKFYCENGRWLLPFSIQVHHAVCDGFHTSRFLRELQELLDQFDNGF